MVCKLYYSPTAADDLENIRNYIEWDLESPSATINIVNDILDMIDILKQFPDAGKCLSTLTDINSDYHFIVSGNYIAFYRHIGNDVYIDRVLNARQDYIRVLSEEYCEYRLQNNEKY